MWRGWRCLGERERRWQGLGVEDGYGRRGEREGEVDMGRRWREWWWRGLGVVDGYGRRGEWGAQWGLWGEGEVDVGRQWRAWRRRGERERWWRGLGVGVAYGRRREREALQGSWGEGGVDMWRRWRLGCGSGGSGAEGGRGGAFGSGSGASGWLRRGGGAGSVSAGGGCAVRGGGVSAAVCGIGAHRSSRASQEASAGPGGLARRSLVLGGLVGLWWRQWVVVRVGLGPGGPPLRGRGAWGDTVAGTGGVAPHGRWGMRVERSVAAFPYAGAVRARGVVARWGRVVGSGSAGGGVGGGGWAAGGGGVGKGGVGAAGTALGPLLGIPVPLVGVGGRASCAAPGAVLFGG